jgi:AcrR family transcriptional regulator
MPTNKPRQKRSRERVEKILLAAADELARTADADKLTTTSVSKRSGVPVATIYRYFADRSSIISALIDEEMSEIDEELARNLDSLKLVTFDVLLESLMGAHLDYFRSSRRAIVLWFGARNSKEVLGRIERRYEYMGRWLMAGAVRSGMAKPDSPPYGGELIVWTCDRAFEYMFREQRGPVVEDEILALSIGMLSRAIDDYTTTLGREGIAHDEFVSAFGKFDPPHGPAH